MDKSIGFAPPPIKLPCCEEYISLPLQLLATLRSAGAETICIDSCYQCRQAHEIPLPDCKKITASFQSELAIPQR